MLFFAILICQAFADYSEGMTYTYATTAKMTMTASASDGSEKASVIDLAFTTHISCIKKTEEEEVFLLRVRDLEIGNFPVEDEKKPPMQQKELEQLAKPIAFIKTKEGKIGSVYSDPSEPESISTFKVGLVHSFRTVRPEDETLIEIDEQGRHYTHVKTNPSSNGLIVFLSYSTEDFMDFRDAGIEPDDLSINVSESLEYDDHLIHSTFDSCRRVTPVRRSHKNGPSTTDELDIMMTENIVFMYLSSSATNEQFDDQVAPERRSGHEIITELFPTLERVSYLTEEEYVDRAIRTKPPRRAISNAAPLLNIPEDPPGITVSETYLWNNSLGSDSLGLYVTAYAYTGSNDNCNASLVHYYIASGAEAELSILSKKYSLLKLEAAFSYLEETYEQFNWMNVSVLGVDVYNKVFPELTCDHSTITLYNYEPRINIPIRYNFRLGDLDFNMYLKGTVKTDVSGRVCQDDGEATINVDSQARMTIGADLTLKILLFKVTISASAEMGEQIIAEGSVNPEYCYMEWKAEEIRDPFKANFKITARFSPFNEDSSITAFQQANDDILDVWNADDKAMNKTHVQKRRTMDLSTKGRLSSGSIIEKAKVWASAHPATTLAIVFTVVGVLAVGAVICAVVVVKKVRSRRAAGAKVDSASSEPLLPTA